MADDKKSIIVYSDWIELFEELTDDEAGKLIKHFFRYVNDKNPIAPDRITELSFIPIKQSLKRDLIKWEGIKVKRSEAGKKSAEARQQTSANLTSVESVEQTSTNPTVSVSVSVNDSVSDINKDLYVEQKKLDHPKIDFDKLLQFINQATGRNFKVINKAVKGKYIARLKEGYTKDQIIKAVVNACKDKNHIENGFKYLTPEFFSRPDKIEMHGSEQTNQPITFIK